jgi:RNA polymerase sigma factor (sigma-70 family)
MTPRVRASQVRAQRQLERDYEALKASTLRSLAAKLRSRGIVVPDADLEAFYNQAWHALYHQLTEGVTIENTGGFLVLVAYRRALDDVSRQAPLRTGLSDAEDHAVEDETVQRLDDRRRLREFVEAMRDELDERERTAASLCYLHGYTRPQAAEAMGLSEGRMKKVMDEVSKTVGRFTREIQAGTRCEGRESANKAYAIGLLDPDGERHAVVRAHLDDCSACRADVLRMRGLAIVAPPLLLPWGAALAVGALAGGGGAAGRGSRTTQTAVGAGVAVAVVAAIVALVLALTGGGKEPTRDPVAKAPAAATPAATSAPPATAASSAAKPKPKPRATPASTPKAQPAARQRAGQPAPTTTQPQPSATVAPAAATAAPAAGPAAAATPTPAQTTPATAAPPVDAYQEFGVEP